MMMMMMICIYSKTAKGCGPQKAMVKKDVKSKGGSQKMAVMVCRLMA